MKVLLVEDDPMVREVNRQFIERVEGFHVIDMAANGIEGLRSYWNCAFIAFKICGNGLFSTNIGSVYLCGFSRCA